MKGNDGTGDRVDRDVWETPKDLFVVLHSAYEFSFDCCATRRNAKTYLFSSDFETITKETLAKQMCWMNPPFSKAKKMFKHFFATASRGIAIYRCDNMETSVWQDSIFKYASWILIPKGRIRYDGFSGSGSRFPSALIGFNVPIMNTYLRNLINEGVCDDYFIVRINTGVFE
jgi:hypothetical protein